MTQPPLRVAVIGAGALGLTAAWRVAQAGHEVVVFEREPRLGGLTASFQMDGASLERFYHHLFRSDRAMTRVLGELGLGHRLEWLHPDTAVLWQGQIRSLDSPVDVLRFSPIDLVARFRLGLVLAYLRVERNYRRLEGKKAAEWLRHWMGESAFRVVWEPLLRSKFGAWANEIALPWFWARVHFRSPDLGYLRGGFQQFYDRLGEEILRLGGAVHLSTAVEAIRTGQDGRPGLVIGGTEQVFDRVIATVPTRLFVRLAEGLPEAYRQRYDRGEAFGAHCVILSLDRPLTNIYWLNVNDPGYPFLALVEHTNLIPPADYGGRHLIYLGNYLPMDHPRFRQADDDVVAEYLPHLAKINPGFQPEWVRERWVFKAPYAQPIVTTEFPGYIPPLETPLPGVYLANMFQVYPQDRGQNYSVLLGERVAQVALGGERRPNESAAVVDGGLRRDLPATDHGAPIERT